VAADVEAVNVYSYRQPFLIDPLLKKFTEDTGIKVNVIFAEKGLIERMAAEGRNSPADLLLTVDVGNLMQAKEAGVGQVVHSQDLEKEIPAAYRDKEGVWWGLTRRARVVYASKERVKLRDITYEDLADPKWKDKICIRSGQHVYNVALTASMIAAHGETWTEQWLKGVKENLAHKPAGDDRMQVKGVYSGECDIAVGNTYYMGAMLQNEKEPEQKEWANSVYILFPNTNDRGTHVNISGAVLAKNAPHKDNALRLMEFLASDEGQQMYAEVNNEYPVKEGVPWSPLVKSWGNFKPDPISLNDIAALRKKASELIDKVGFDDGPST
jgi:iron(III) transport system substrate-binding protein